MDLKSAVRPLVPPFIYRGAQMLAGLGRETPPLSFSPRPTFDEAAADAGAGYGDASLLSHFAAAPLIGMQDFVAPAIATIALASKTATRPLRVLDFGGGSGYFRSYIDQFFDGAIKTAWHVVETPEQVRHNEGSPCAGPTYSTSIGAEPYDVALFSGSLQYVRDWRAPLRETKSKLIFISRTPLDEFERPFLQTCVRNGMVFRLPGRVICRSALSGVLSETHDLFADWTSQSHLFDMGICQSPAMLWRARL